MRQLTGLTGWTWNLHWIIFSSLQTDNDPVQGFSQTFYLKQIGESLFVMNDIFRLHLHHSAWWLIDDIVDAAYCMYGTDGYIASIDVCM